MRNYLSLRYFVELARCLNFSDAAKKLHISQPGLSQQIARLEQEIGHKLLHRTTRAVTLTEAGEYLQRHLSHSFQNIDRVLSKLQQGGDIPQPTLRIATVMSAASTIVPELIKRLRNTRSELEFYIHETTSLNAIELVLSGEYELGFVRIRTDSKQPLRDGIEWFEFESHPLQLAVSEDHWAADAEQVELYDLKDETFLHYDPQVSPSLYSLLEYACLAAGFIPQSIGAGPEVLTRANLIRSGIGITLLPRDMIRLLEPYAIKGVPLSGVGLNSSLSVIWDPTKLTGLSRDALRVLRSMDE